MWLFFELTVSDRKNNFAEHQICYLQNILVFQFDLQLSRKLVLDKSSHWKGSGCHFCFYGVNNENGEKRINTSFSLEITNVRAKDHDNRSRRLAFTVRGR